MCHLGARMRAARRMCRKGSCRGLGDSIWSSGIQGWEAGSFTHWLREERCNKQKENRTGRKYKEQEVLKILRELTRV